MIFWIYPSKTFDIFRSEYHTLKFDILILFIQESRKVKETKPRK